MVRPWKIEYDYAMVDALYKYVNLGYRELKEKIESVEHLNKSISDETFDLHLHALSNLTIRVNAKNWRRGQKMVFSLKPKVKQEKHIGSFKIEHEAKNRRIFRTPAIIKNEFSAEKRIKIIYTIIGMSSTKVNLRNNSLRAIVDELRKKILTHSRLSMKNIIIGKLIGLSVNEIIEGSQGLLEFWHEKFRRKAVIESIRVLKKEKVIGEIRVRGEGPRYIAINTDFENFVLDCLKVRDAVIMPRFLNKWNNIRLPYPEERSYYEFCNGKEYTNKEIIKSRDFLVKQKSQNNYNQIRKNSIEFIERSDYNAYKFIYDIKKRYSNLINDHPALTNSILKTIYPAFLKKEGEKAHRKAREKGATYLPLTVITQWGSIKD